MRIYLQQQRATAFTLIELVISAAVGAMILAGAYLCLSAGISTQKVIDPRVEVLQSARVAMAMMSADLRSACPLDKNYAFLGMHRALETMDADNMDFATHNYTPRRPNEGDFCETSYFVQKDRETGQLNLWRRRNPTLALDPLSGGRREKIASGLQGVRFDYTDGLDWYDTWGETNSEKKMGLIAQAAANLDGMPQAVRITLSFAASVPKTNAPPASDLSEAATEQRPEPPLVFQTVVHLELADSAAEPVEAGAANSPNSPQNGPAPGGPPGGSQ